LTLLNAVTIELFQTTIAAPINVASIGQSRWLVEQWNLMTKWKDRGYEGLDRTECPEHWSCIIHDVESAHRRIQIAFGTGEQFSEFKEAAMLYAKESLTTLRRF
jgi:hypothetical protein